MNATYLNGPRIAAIIVAATGMLTLATGFLLLQKRLEMIRKWRPVEAQVVKAEMEERTSGTGTDQSTSYLAIYELSYVVDGKPVVATARSEDDLLSQPALVQAKLDRHAPGTTGIIFVNPNNLADVRLNLGRNVDTLAGALWVWLAAAFLLLTGISLWLIGTPTVFW